MNGRRKRTGTPFIFFAAIYIIIIILKFTYKDLNNDVVAPIFEKQKNEVKLTVILT